MNPTHAILRSVGILAGIAGGLLVSLAAVPGSPRRRPGRPAGPGAGHAAACRSQPRLNHRLPTSPGTTTVQGHPERASRGPHTGLT